MTAVKGPEVSVVMGVYNGEESLAASIESILSQEGVNFEFIIINDGSTDKGSEIINAYVRHDDRVHAIHQPNAGLTQALIRGCSEARGQFIARQDVGDISLPGRLVVQRDYLVANDDIVLASCWSRQVAPDGEILFENERDDDERTATVRLRHFSFDEVRGLSHHGSAMFRRDAYKRCGGYRPQFYFAQDLDLWRRITDYGLLGFVRTCLYESSWSEGSISASFHDAQRALKKIIITLSDVEPGGTKEWELLKQAETIRPTSNGGKQRRKGEGNYFIGRMLQQRGDPNAGKYLKRAMAENPLLWRAAFALLFGGVGKGWKSDR